MDLNKMMSINSRINGVNKTEVKEVTMRDMLKITRRLNEVDGNKATAYDQPNEEKKLLNNFKDINVNIRFIDLEVNDEQLDKELGA